VNRISDHVPPDAGVCSLDQALHNIDLNYVRANREQVSAACYGSGQVYFVRRK